MTTDTTDTQAEEEILQNLVESAREALRAPELSDDDFNYSQHPGRYEWLDLHRDAVVRVVEAFGAGPVAESLGFNRNTLHSWRRRRGLQPSEAEWHANQAARLNAATDSPGSGTVALDAIAGNPWQPRRSMDPDGIRELAESIATSGLLQTPVGRRIADGTVQLAFGHRRVEAIRLLEGEGRWEGGVPVDVRELSDQQMAVFALEENRKRRDITPLEEYMGYKKVIDDGLLSVTELAETLGLARSTVSNNLRILNLPQFVLDLYGDGTLSAHAAREFLSLWSADHVHEADMASIIADTKRSYGAPDWRDRSIRSEIYSQVVSRNAQAWRPLSKNTSYSLYAAPGFDVKAFTREFPTMVHNIAGSTDKTTPWTCNVKEWQKRQAEATRAANQARASGENVDHHAAASPEQAQRLIAVLENDPVRLAIAAGREVDTPVPAGNADEAEPRSEPQDAKGAEYKNLNELLDEVLEEDDGDTDLDLEAARDALDLTVLTDDEIARAFNAAVNRYNERARRAQERTEATTVVPGLSEEEVEKLGTRANAILLDDGGWHAPLQVPWRTLPFGFPDVEECLTRCTWGATYAAFYGRDIQLVCLNQKHFQEKLAKGREEKWQEVLQEAEEEAKADQELAAQLAPPWSGTLPDDFLRGVVLALMWEQEAHHLRRPQGVRERGWELPYSMSKRVQEILGLPEPDPEENDAYHYAGVELVPTPEIVAKIDALGARELGELAAQLIVYSHRRMGQ